MKTKKVLLALFALILAAALTQAASAQETHLAGRGAFHASDAQAAYLGVRIGAVKMDVTDATVVVHGHSRLKVTAEGGDLVNVGKTYIFTGTGTLEIKGINYIVAGSGDINGMLAIGKGHALIEGTDSIMAIGWKQRDSTEVEDNQMIDAARNVLASVESGELDAEAADAALSEIKPASIDAKQGNKARMDVKGKEGEGNSQQAKRGTRNMNKNKDNNNLGFGLGNILG